jgi:DNA-directed RNA polymerase subunit delta
MCEGKCPGLSSQYTLKINAEKAKEMPMVDLAFEVLKAANIPFYYRDLMQEIAKIKGIPDDEVMQVIAQLYTEINIDGRFACVGTNLWGLKRWYPVEKAEDAVGNAKRPRIINDEDDDLDDDDLFSEEEDDSYAGDDDEDFDKVDSDSDELFEDGDDDSEEIEEEEDAVDDEEIADDDSESDADGDLDDDADDVDSGDFDEEEDNK